MNRFSFLPTFCSIDIDVGYKIAIFVKAIEGDASQTLTGGPHDGSLELPFHLLKSRSDNNKSVQKANLTG